MVRDNGVGFDMATAERLFAVGDALRLGVSPEEVPLLVGELLYADQGGEMGWFNDIVAEVPNLVPNAHIISAEGCPMLPGDTYNLHFSKDGYKILGERYADKMLELMGYK